MKKFFLLVMLGLLFVKSFNYFTLPRELFNSGAHLQLIPSLMSLNQLPVIENTMPAFLQVNGSLLPSIQLFILKYLGVAPLSLFIFLSFLQLAIGALGCYWIAQAIFLSRWGGLYSLAFVFWGWLHTSTIGYLIEWDLGMFTGMFGIAIGFLVLALWFRNHRMAALILTGLLFDIHPGNGLVVGALLFFQILFDLKNLRADKKVWRSLGIGIAIGFVIALPQLFLIFQTEVPKIPENLRETWWQWMELRKSYHLFPWKHTYQVFQLGLLTSILAAILFAVHKHRLIPTDITRKITALLLSVYLLIFVSWVGVEVFHNSTIAMLILTRSSTFLVPVTGALIFVLGWHFIQSPSWAYHLFGSAILIANFLPLRQPRYWLLPASLYFLGSAFLWRKSISPLQNTIPARVTSSAWVLGLLILAFGVQQEYLAHQRTLEDPTTDWRSLQELEIWAKDHTSPDTVFLTPQQLVCSVACLGRTTLVVAHDLGASVYFPSALQFELKILNSLFRLDLRDKERAKSLRLDISRYFTETYRQLETTDFQRIKKDFPHLRYVVTYSEHTVELPLVFRNARYNVYDLGA